jgi:hypothetical protein
MLIFLLVAIDLIAEGDGGATFLYHAAFCNSRINLAPHSSTVIFKSLKSMVEYHQLDFPKLDGMAL